MVGSLVYFCEKFKFKKFRNCQARNTKNLSPSNVGFDLPGIVNQIEVTVYSFLTLSTILPSIGAMEYLRNINNK